MWPILLDMTKDECKRSLRRLELEAYSNVVSALRAQGSLSTEKNKLLQDVASTLNIPQERHRAEIRRAVNDERLATIAHCMTGDDSSDEWALEGRRLIPLMPRLAPQTAYSVIADDEANKVSLENEKLPLPANTERKRPLQTSTTETLNKNVSHRERDVHFRMPSESSSKSSVQVKINMDEIVSKKRKSSMNMESSSLAQHLMMAQPKLSRVQQIYRQKTKAILKSQMKQRPPIPQIQKINTNAINNNKQQQQQQQQEDESINSNLNTNSIQEVPISNTHTHTHTHTKQQIENKIINQVTIAAAGSTETQQTPKNNKPTIISTTIIKPGNNTSTNTNTNTNNITTTTINNNNNTIIPQQQQQQQQSSSSEVAQQKSIKICPARKVITTSARTPTTPQKVIIVSTPQGTTTNPSILQRTLSSIPFMKTISMKNLDKVKVINSPSLSTASTMLSAAAAGQKPKMLTVQTKTKGKQVSIPFIQGVQLQALQNKGAIKMLPLTTTTITKGTTTKPTIISTTAGSVYIMNSNTTLPLVTASSNTAPVLSTKTDVEPTTTTNNIIILKNELIKAATPVKHKTTDASESEAEKELKKSSVLAEILKASGVIPNDYNNDPNDNDIESQISQLTEIPNVNTHVISSNTTTGTTTITTTTTTNTNTNTNKNNIKTEELELKSEYLEEELISNENIEIVIKNENVQIDVKNEHLEHELSNDQFQSIIHENCQNEVHFEETETEMEVSHQDSQNFVILQENDEHTETIIMEGEHAHDSIIETNEEVVELMGSLDPETGMYSMKTAQEYELIDDVDIEIDTNQSQSQSQLLPPDSYIIEMQMESLHNSDLDMPSLSN